MDSSTFYKRIGNTSNGNGSTVYFNWPGTNINTVTLYAGTTSTITSPVVIVPVRYTKNNSFNPGNDFIGIPQGPGIIIDSVKDETTGLKVTTEAGSGIYQVGYLANGSTRDFDVYTHIQLCQNDSLTIYADRTPCSG